MTTAHPPVRTSSAATPLPDAGPAPDAPRSAAVSVHLLVFPDATPIVPVGLFDLLRKAAQIAHQAGATVGFEPVLVAASGTSTRVSAAGGLALECRYHLDSAPPADIVVVSPLDPEILDAHSRRPALGRFLRDAHDRGSTLSSVCTGAFGLAESGLLDGRRAATHWAFQDLFRARFPRVRLLPQETIVDEGRLITTGGATAFLNLAVYLVERQYGAEVARAASRMFLIDERRPPQGSYAIFAGQRQHGDEQVLAAQDLIEREGPGPLSVDGLAAEVAMSRRTFIRRFKAATGAPPSEYMQRARMEAAKRRLEATGDTVSEVARLSGYDDVAAFRRMFQRHVGVTPAEYRSRHARPRR